MKTTNEDIDERNVTEHTGWLFDLYPRADQMVLWFITDQGRRLRLLDPFAPEFYVAGFMDDTPPGPLGRSAAPTRKQFFQTLKRMDGLAARGPAERIDFWTGRPRRVEAVGVTDLGRAKISLHRLARRFPALLYFNADILPEVHYGYDRGLFPGARCAFRSRGDRLVACRPLDAPDDTDYAPLPLLEAELRADGVFVGKRPRLTSLSLEIDGRTLTWEEGPPAALLASFRDALRDADPDLIWSSGGDSGLFPALLSLAEQCGIDDLGLDREPAVERELVAEGRTYISYGRVLYQAPDYPLYGRWHIDRRNSFWTDETGLHGLLEVARLSKIPVQRAARRSIGTGISSIQLDLAYREGVLIPWKKTQPEAWKSATTLLKADRGGLVYQPLVGVYEDVVELDFASMYPTIMVRCNVSPETVNCACCTPDPTLGDATGAYGLGRESPNERNGAVPNENPRVVPPDSKTFAEAAEHTALYANREEPDFAHGDVPAERRRDVPEIGYTLCRRRHGLVSRALEPIVSKRARYKQIMKAAAPDKANDPEALERYTRANGRQGALKWLLVCCFGYLGYRNARFGRIEAHESTCAFSREKLIQTREISEAHGFEMLHAIVDCVWLRKPGMTRAEIDALCEEVGRETNLILAVEGRYRWIVFLPSRQHPDMPVPNRYFGAFTDGTLKFRGIELRRSDQPPYVKTLQSDLLDRLATAPSLAAIRRRREEFVELVLDAERRVLHYETPPEELYLRRKTSREAEEYKGNAMTAVAARQARRAGLPLHAGEALNFLVLNAKDRDPDSRLRLVPLLRPEDLYDAEFYAELVRRAAVTLLEPLFGCPLHELLGREDPALKRRKTSAARAAPRQRKPPPSKSKRGRNNEAPRPGEPVVTQPDFLDLAPVEGSAAEAPEKK